MLHLDNVTLFFAVYFAAISIVSAVLCLYDKSQSKRGGRRIRESALLWISFFGGAAVMYVVMKKIRHKTRHKRFMIGLPLMILFHIAVAVLAVLNLDNGLF